MKPEDWIKNNRATFDSEYEALFAKQVLPLVGGLKWETVTAQHPFVDSDGRNRYCDFTIIESQSVRVAIEIDGYDKRGTGSGMTHAEFLDWQRRQASLASQGWYVLRFANRDVRDAPQLCAKHITSLLNRLRQAQGGHIEIVTIQPTGSDLISASPQVISAQISEMRPKSNYKFALFAGFFFFAIFAAWKINIFDYWRDTGTYEKTTETPYFYGTSDCKNPQDWTVAKNQIGKVVTVIGPLLESRARPDTTGSPLWMDVGNIYPERNRLTVIVWGQNWKKFDMSELDAEYWQYRSDGNGSAFFCITGRVSEFKGVPQIELTTPDQIRIWLVMND